MAFQPITGGSGNATTDIQNLTTHGFVVGDVVYHNGTTWLKASAALGTSIAQAVVSQVVDVNNFRVVYSGILIAVAHGKTVGNYYYLDQTVSGTTTATHPTTGIVQQIYHVKDANTLLVDISNAFTAVNTVPDIPLTYGRVNAGINLISKSFVATGIGTVVDFTSSVYSSGMTFSGTNGIIPSIAGRYRASYYLNTGSDVTAYNATVNIVQNGISLGSIYINQHNSAGSVNQSSGFIDVNVVEGIPVFLHYQPDTTEAIEFDQGTYFDLSQLPTAVAPIVDYIAEYGTQTLATTTDVNTNAGTWVNKPISITLPSAGTYKLSWQSSGGIGDNTTTQIILSGRLFNTNTNSEYSKTQKIISSRDGETTALSFIVNTGSGEDIVTVTGATTIVLQTKITVIASNAATILGDNGTNGSTYISYQKIAGGLPSTGQTVDYVSATLSVDQTTNLTSGDHIKFNSVANGNITVDTSSTYSSVSGVASIGRITLLAGKTYKLSGQISSALNGVSGVSSYRWFNATTGTAISGSSIGWVTSPANTSTHQRGGISEAIFTPTVDTLVELRILSNMTTPIDGGEGTSIFIQQLGSSAVYAGSFPQVWTNFTPTITGTTTNPTLPTSAVIFGSYMVMGKTLFMNFKYSSASVASGNDGVGTYGFTLPPSIILDMTKLTIPDTITNVSGSGILGGSTIGTGFGRNSTGGNSSGLSIFPLTSTSVCAYFEGQTRLIGASSLALTSASNTMITFTIQAPII